MVRIIFFSFFFATSALSQNYVVNGSFERTRTAAGGAPPVCEFSGSPDILNGFAEAWQTYEEMTPDLLVVDTNTTDCTMRPRRGTRMVGLIMYHPATDGAKGIDYHELIQGTLAKPLEKGKTYRVRFWTRTADSLGRRHLQQVYGPKQAVCPVRCGNFGFFFSQNKINLRENFMQSQSIFPVEPQINWAGVVETPGGEWRSITLLLKADQPYRYFLFGNLFFDSVTPTSQSPEERAQLDAANMATAFAPEKNVRIAYYCFDDFVVDEWTGNDVARTLLEKKKLAFDTELLFDVDQATLKPGAQTALDQLVEALNALPTYRVEIGGHTDDTGDAAYNRQLSEHRARAVYDYLVAKAIPANQLAWQGYGEAQPTAANDSAEGRQKNRRVECKILE